jgi:AsmA protein
MIRRLVLLGIELVVAVVLVAVAGLFYASYYIDTREFRILFTDTLSRATGREVRLVGELNINLWPEILLEVGGLTIGEDPELGTEPFARFETIHVNVQVLPLLARSIMIESVFVDGLQVAVIVDENGRFNLESFIRSVQGSGDGAASNDWALSLSNIEIANTNVLFQDRRDDREWRLSGISLRTGDIRADSPIPVTVGSGFSSEELGLRADLALTGLFGFNPDLSDLRLDDAIVTATVHGDFLPEDAEPGELTAGVAFDWEHRTVSLQDFQAQLLGLRAEGSITSGDLRESLSGQGHVTVRPFVPASLISRFAPEAPVASVDGLKSSAFASFFRIDETGVRFEKLVATLDDITVRGDLGMSGFTTPVFDFALRSTTIDLDRYLPLFRTGTPFIWDDFNLPLFRAFKGQGTVRSDGLTLLDTLLSDIRLKVTADKSIVIDAGAIKEGQASVGGTVEVVLGADAESSMPTLSMKAHIDAESQKDGFAFLHGDKASLGGVGSIGVELTVPPMPCPPQERSMNLVNRVTGTVDLALLNGVARIRGTSGKGREVPYAEFKLKADMSPGNGPAQYWNPVIAASMRMQGGTDVETLSVDVQGPASVAWDESHLVTTGASVNGSGFLAVLPEGSRRVNASALVVYDSKTHTVGIEDGFLQVLETIVTGRGVVTGLNDEIEGTGEFAIRDADPKRLIFLLTGEDFPTADPEALHSWSLASRVAADKEGFTLNNAVADIDGMAVSGQVVGNGYDNPMLSFSLNGGRLDIDRYLPPKPERTLEERRTKKYVKAPPVKLPLKFLGALRLNGKAALEELKLAKIRSKGVTGDIMAESGQIHVSKVQGATYEGALTADWNGQINREFLTTRLQLHVEDMQAGPLTRDLGGKEYVRGLTDVDMDLVSQGATDDDILKNLNGKVDVRVTNGSFKFSGFPKEGEIAPGTMSKQEIDKMEQRARSRTVFQKAVGDFTVKNGVFTADKFRVEAPPVLQSYGKGGFSLPDNTIDLSIQNDFVVVPSVTLVLSGRLTDPEVSIPTGDILNDTVVNILSIPKKSFDFLRDLFTP